MADTEFKLSDEQLEFLKHHEIADETINGITTADAYNALKRQIEEDIVKSYLQSRLSGDEFKQTDDLLAIPAKERQEMLDKAADDMMKDVSDEQKEKIKEKADHLKKDWDALDIESNGNGEENQNTDNTWIEEKRRYYQSLSDMTEINDYKPDDTVPGFAAKFNNASIHYSSPTHVTVSSNAGIEVFCALLNEDSNKGRPVNFAENLPREMKLRLYAAAIICGNELGDNAPQELSEEDLKFIREELKDNTKGRLEKFDENYAKLHPEKEPEQEQDVAADIKQALKDQYRMANLERTGKIVLDKDGKAAKSDSCSDDEFNEYETARDRKFKLEDKEVDGKTFLAAQFAADAIAVRVAAGDLIREMQDEAKAKKQAVNNEDLPDKDKDEKIAEITKNLQDKIASHREDQKAFKVKNMSADDLKEHQDKEAKREDRRNIIKAQLGLLGQEEYNDIDGTKKLRPTIYLAADGTGYTKLKGKNFDKFIMEKGISSDLYVQLGGDKDAIPAACKEVDKVITEKFKSKEGGRK